MLPFYLSCKDRKVISKNYCGKIFFAAALLLLINSRSIAQVQWTNTGSATSWNDPANWTPNTVYGAWSPTDIAQFNNTGTALTAGIDMSQGPLSIGAITIGGRTRDLTIGNSSTTNGTLTLNGATVGSYSDVIIYQIAASPGIKINIQDNETGSGKKMDIVLTGSGSNMIWATSTIEIKSAITGINKKLLIEGTPGAQVILSGANTYTGLTSLATSGTGLTLNRPGGNTLPGDTNDVAIGAGTLQVLSNQTLRNVDLGYNGYLNVGTGATLTITGTFRNANPGGHVIVSGTGKIVYAPGASLVYENASAVTTTSAEFPAVGGPTNLEVVGGITATLHAPRTISGALKFSGGYLALAANNFTCSSTVNNTGASGFVITNGIGFLVNPSVGAAATIFPVGASATTFNPLTITNGGGLVYGARVKNGIDGPLSLPAIYESVNRLWILYQPVVSPSPVNFSFGYSNTDGNPGFDYTAPVALSQINAGPGWSTVQSNVPQVQPVTFTSTGAIATPVNTAFVVANSSSPMGTQKLWTDAGSATDWYGATNWAPNTSAASWVPGDYAQFNNTGTAVTAGIDMSQGSLSLGAIVIGTRTRDLTIGNSSITNGTLTLRGISINGHNDVIIFQTSTSSVAKLIIQDNETGTGKHMDIALTNPGYSRIFAMSTVEIKSAITGPDKKMIFDGGGLGYVILTGANSYSGHTIVTASAIRVALARPGGSTFTGDTNDITVGGRLEVLTDQTLRNVLVKKDGFLTVGNGATLTITGTLTDINTDLNHIICVGTGKIVYAPAGNLVYNSGIALTTSSAELPLANGPARIEVGTGTSVTLHESRTINGPLTLAGGTLSIGSNSLTCNSVTGTSGSVITNGTGRLIVKNVGVAPVSFPVTTGGVTNTVTIANGQGLDYGVGVVEGISPVIVNNSNAVNRTWYIKPSATPLQPVNVTFSYSNGDGNVAFNYSAPVEVAQYTGAWNVLQSGMVQVQPLAVTLDNLTGNTDNAFIISNVGAVLASSPVDFNAVKQNDKGHLTWTIENTATLKQLQIERSSDGRNFISLATVATTSIYFDDNQLLSATNYYRLKMTDVNGKISYSITIALINGKTGFDMVSILPTVVNSNATLNVTTAQKTRIDLLITDAAGRKIQQMKYTINAGSSQLPLNLAKLSTGVYVIMAQTPEGDTKTLRFVKN